MALVLTMQTGEDFYVRDQRVTVHKIMSPTKFVLSKADGEQVTITDRRAVELFDKVFVSAGARGQDNQARVSIEADRAIPLVRGVNYRRA